MARRSISFAYGEGYVSIYRVIRPAISVTSTASAGSRATFVVYDCNATNVDRSPGNGGAGLIEIDLQRWPTATLLAVFWSERHLSALGRFSGPLRISDARRSWRFHAKTPTFDGIRIQWGSRDIGRLRTANRRTPLFGLSYPYEERRKGHLSSVRSLVGTISAVCASRPVLVLRPVCLPPDWPAAVPAP